MDKNRNRQCLNMQHMVEREIFMIKQFCIIQREKEQFGKLQKQSFGFQNKMLMLNVSVELCFINIQRNYYKTVEKRHFIMTPLALLNSQMVLN